MSMLAAILVLSSAPAQAEPAVVTGPIVMKQSEIKAYNANLPRDHPNYIRCVRYAAPGSLVANKQTCRTNAQWVIANRIGEQNARDTAESMRYRLEAPVDSVCKDGASC
jgi:hypothetical protein